MDNTVFARTEGTEIKKPNNGPYMEPCGTLSFIVTFVVNSIWLLLTLKI